MSAVRLRVLLAVLVTVLAALPAAAGARADAPGLLGYGEAQVRISQLPLRGFTGGPITTTNTGETVRLYVADAYLTADPTFAQRFADLLGALVHGPEIATVTTYVAPLETVGRVCGTRALACYDPRSETIITPGDDVAGRITAAGVLAHEYGHHLANNRDNDPWAAIDYGTKRWASYTNVCRQAEAGALVPGDEGENYRLNPGEGFAEAYRVLNERRQGIAESPWGIVSRLMYPDDEALRRLEQDVVEPWMRQPPTVVRGRFTKGGASARTLALPTPHDGALSVTLKSSLNTKLELRLRGADGKVVALDATGARTKTLTFDICGERSFKIGVRRASGAGTYVLSISKP